MGGKNPSNIRAKEIVELDGRKKIFSKSSREIARRLLKTLILKLLILIFKVIRKALYI